MKNKRSILRNHIMPLTDQIDYGLCDCAIDYKTMCHELVNFFLGEDWYVVLPEHDTQAMSAALYDIEYLYWKKGNRKKIFKRQYSSIRKYCRRQNGKLPGLMKTMTMPYPF